MKTEKQEIETLAQLGLTKCQANIYLTLVSSGTSTAQMISNNSRVSREHVYPILSKLEQKGFVERLIGTPNQFKPMPLEFAASILFEKRKQETFQLEKQTSKILHKYSLKQKETKFEKEEPMFVLVPKKEASIRKRLQEIVFAQTNIDIITSWKRFPPTIHTFGDELKEALKRKVRIRMILEKPSKGESLPEFISVLKEFPNYEIRYIFNPPSAIFAIFDKKRMMIKTSASVGFAEVPSLWTNNPCLLSLINDCFELNWRTALQKYAIKELEA